MDTKTTLLDDKNLSCDILGKCSGCFYEKPSFYQQIKNKEEEFRENWLSSGLDEDLLKGFSIEPIEPWGLRDRVDLTIKKVGDKRVIGLYGKESADIVDMHDCPQMSVTLNNWFQEFRSHLPPIDLGSVRLRVSPEGLKGAWLDFPNTTVKYILEEKKWLSWLYDTAVTEVGQRKKRLIKDNSNFKLGDPSYSPWFQTYINKNENWSPIPIYSSIASFSQVGIKANRALILNVLKHISKNDEVWMELGSGTGNFTFPMASQLKKVFALELDKNAIASFKYSLESNRQQGQLFDNIDIEKVNFHRYSGSLANLLKECDGILVDPPRSGLKDFLKTLKDVQINSLPKRFIYISCFHKSLTEDLKELLAMKYKICHIQGLDQFPFSRHCEYITVLER